MFTDQDIIEFEKNGAIILRNIFINWIPLIKKGIKLNLNNPSVFSSENGVKITEGRFFDDYNNWKRIGEFKALIEESRAAEISALFMRSKTSRFFHDHVLVKEAGTAKPTEWHRDIPFYYADGEQMVSFWMPVDPIIDSGLRIIAGSHKWIMPNRPLDWLSESNSFSNEHEWLASSFPDVIPENETILEWQLEPGDAILFDMRTFHGAKGNYSNFPRRVLSLRWLGDDVSITQRLGRDQPFFPGHNSIIELSGNEIEFPQIWPPEK